jgi:small subunit ribosomal protein S16
MRRAGAKNRPFFRIVVTESAEKRDGRFVEVLGHYDPRTKPETVNLDRERLAHWINAGARPSDTVRTLVQRLPADAPAEAPADAPAAAAAGEPAAS